MVEFITLLLGLVVGPQTVELAAETSVARIELRLDGSAVAEIRGQPWSARVDFGPRLEPRLLEALAYDAEGEKLGQTRQIVNYARRNHEAVLILESPDRDGTRRGSVLWEAVLDRKPKRIELTLDGRAVPVTKRGEFRLPPLDLQEVHSLSASLSFGDRRSAQADLVFGGVYGERISSALTAVSVLVPPDESLPPAEQMGGFFGGGNARLSVFSHARGAARLMVVRDPDLRGEIKDLAPQLARYRRMPPQPVVGGDDSVRFVPISTLAHHPGHFRAIEITPAKLRFGLWDLISRSYPRQPVRGKRELWAAVAAAGLGAAEGDHRRAVIVLLARSPRDASGVTASQAIGYLRSVRAPHFLWAPRRRDLPALRGDLLANTFVGAEGLSRLFDEVEKSLRSQRMVWLEGLHFPARVRLESPPGSELRLAE